MGAQQPRNFACHLFFEDIAKVLVLDPDPKSKSVRVTLPKLCRGDRFNVGGPRAESIQLRVLLLGMLLVRLDDLSLCRNVRRKGSLDEHEHASGSHVNVVPLPRDRLLPLERCSLLDTRTERRHPLQHDDSLEKLLELGSHEGTVSAALQKGEESVLGPFAEHRPEAPGHQRCV